MSSKHLTRQVFTGDDGKTYIVSVHLTTEVLRLPDGMQSDTDKINAILDKAGLLSRGIKGVAELASQFKYYRDRVKELEQKG